MLKRIVSLPILFPLHGWRYLKAVAINGKEPGRNGDLATKDKVRMYRMIREGEYESAIAYSVLKTGSPASAFIPVPDYLGGEFKYPPELFARIASNLTDRKEVSYLLSRGSDKHMNIIMNLSPHGSPRELRESMETIVNTLYPTMITSNPTQLFQKTMIGSEDEIKEEKPPLLHFEINA